MTKGKGYLLPAGDASEDELECCLVFYPARDEYRRALMGSLDYLATWIAWERDSEKRGQEAAASWKLANIQTWECCAMGYCDDLLTTLEALLAATTALECCGDQDITDGRQYTDEIVDGVGDVPQNIIDAGYADDAADWIGFDDYKCMISHLAVDHIESFLREIAPHISDTGIVIGGVGVVGALVGAILTLVGLPISAGIIIALGAAAAIWTWITSEGRDAVEDLADEIATSHDELVCAIYQGDGVTDSVSDFNDEVDALFSPLNAVAIKAINIEPQLRAMYAGRYDQEDIAQKLDDLGYEVTSYDCSTCGDPDPPSGFHLEYPTSIGSVIWHSNTENRVITYNAASGALHIEFTTKVGNQFSIALSMPDSEWGWDGHTLRLNGYTGPSDTYAQVHSVPFPVTQSIGETHAGYRSDKHSGSEWDDWLAGFDHSTTYAPNPLDLEFEETPNASATPSTFYSWDVTIRQLVPD